MEMKEARGTWTAGCGKPVCPRNEEGWRDTKRIKRRIIK
jgi:hypothetical protein